MRRISGMLLPGAPSDRESHGPESHIPRADGVERRAARATAAVRATAVLLALVSVAGWVGASDQAGSFDPGAWLQGAAGFFGAIESLKTVEPPAPMVVYFYTDWCGYCRQFERELLGTPPVKKYFEEMLAVRINPESGSRERSIADYYGVSGFPAFFVHSGRSKTLSRVERMRIVNGQPQIMTPDEFIAAVSAAGAR